MTPCRKTIAEIEAEYDRELLLNYERRCQAHDEYIEERRNCLIYKIAKLKQCTDVGDSYSISECSALRSELEQLEAHLKHVQGLK